MNTPTPNLAYWRNREASKGYLLATTFSLTIVGYPVAAPFIQWLSPEGSGPAIILKSAIVALCALCFRVFYVRQRIGLSWLLPLSLFLLLYSLRLGENFFARDLTWQAEPIAVFGNFFGAGVLPALLLAPSIQEIDERALSKVVMLLAVLFLIGLIANWEELAAAAQARQASLEKLNQISLGAAGVSMALALMALPTRNATSNIVRYALIIGLLAAAAFTQARGPMVSGAVALLAAALFSPGRYRTVIVRTTLLIALAAIVLPPLFDFDFADFAFKRFFVDHADFANSNNDSVWLRQRSWPAAWEQFRQSPIVGDKVFEPTMMSYPHNIFLESLISVGLIGTTLLIISLLKCASACRSLLSAPDSSNIERIVPILFVKEFVAAQFSGAIWGSGSFIVLSACVLTLGASRQYQSRNRLNATTIWRKNYYLR